MITCLLLFLTFTACSSISEKEESSPSYQDSFQHGNNQQLDILMVIDNSASMEQYQNQVVRELVEYMPRLDSKGIDYRLGVTTTTVQDSYVSTCTTEDLDKIPSVGRLVSVNNQDDFIVTPQTEKSNALFEKLFNVGLCGNNFEMGLDAAVAVIQNQNLNFLRETAKLLIVFISDEEDLSPRAVREYVNDIYNTKVETVRKDIFVNALIVKNEEDCSTEQQMHGTTKGDRYLEFASHFRGKAFSICSNSFSDFLQEFSNPVQHNNVFKLSQKPESQSINVSIIAPNYDEMIYTCNSVEYPWRYEEINEEGYIRFLGETQLAIDSQIIVKYNIGQGGHFECDKGFDCSSSVDCALEEFCNEGQCESGCREIEDCLAGYECALSSGLCEPLGCSEVNLDCEAGESCDLITSECYQELESCSLCTFEEVFNLSQEDNLCSQTSSVGNPCTVDIFGTQVGCSDSKICYPDDVSLYLSRRENSDITPISGQCLAFYKYLTASMFSNNECPASFEEFDVSTNTGVPVYDLCIGDCDLLLNEGYLD